MVRPLIGQRLLCLRQGHWLLVTIPRVQIILKKKNSYRKEENEAAWVTGAQAAGRVGLTLPRTGYGGWMIPVDFDKIQVCDRTFSGIVGIIHDGDACFGRRLITKRPLVVT